MVALLAFHFLLKIKITFSTYYLLEQKEIEQNINKQDIVRFHDIFTNLIHFVDFVACFFMFPFLTLNRVPTFIRLYQNIENACYCCFLLPLKGGAGFEPAYADLQSATLPLGDPPLMSKDGLLFNLFQSPWL